MKLFFPNFLIRNLDTLLASAAGGAIIFLYTRHSGIGVSPDSVVYQSVAVHLARRGTALDYNLIPVVNFPLGYPLILAALEDLTRLDPYRLAPVLNILLFAGLICLGGMLTDRLTIPSRTLKVSLFCLMVFSPCLLEIYSMLWSETWYLFLELCFFLALSVCLERPALWRLFSLGLLAGAACLTRYAGITLLATGGWMLLWHTRQGWRARIRSLLAYGLAGMLPLGINLLRNYRVSGTLTGHRERSLVSLGTNIRDFGKVLSDWNPVFTYRFALPLAILVFLGFFWLYRNYNLRRRGPAGMDGILVTYFLVYGVFIIGMASLSRFEELSSRLLSPAYIPFLLGLSSWIPVSLGKLTKKFRLPGILILVLLFGAFLGNEIWQDYENYDGIKDAGVPGYTEDDWTYSHTVGFLEAHQGVWEQGDTLYSDAPDAIFFFTGLRSMPLPHRNDQTGIREFLACQHYYVFWFNDAENPDLISQGRIMSKKGILPLREFDDGRVWGSSEPPGSR